MYDMAKRSLAFTVATGGLLLTGTGYAPADAAVGFGTVPGPAQAQGSAVANQASPTSVSTPISVRGPESAGPAALAQKPAVRTVTPLDPRSAGSGVGAAASSTVKNDGGILTGNTVQIPIDLGLNLCTNQADAAALSNSVNGSTCGGSGAAGGSNSGASATASTSHTRGILSGNTVQAPINVPIEACGNQVVVIGAKNKVGGGTCGTGGPGSGGSGSGGSGGASATAVTDHSGGILSGNIIQAPVNVPVNACGNQVNGVALKDKVGGTTCSTGPSGPGSGGSSATAIINHSGGIGSGMTVQAPIDVPVNACGNQVTVGGLRDRTGTATCANSGGSTSALSATMNSGGIASGTSGQLPINVPVEACGNQAGVGSVSGSTDSPVCTMPPPTISQTSVVTNSGGILSGNQPTIPIDVPVNVCGDQAVVGGLNNTAGSPECGTHHSPSPSPSTSESESPSPSPSTSGSGSPSPSPSTSGPGSPSPSPSMTGPGSPTPSATNTPPSGGNTTPPGGPGTHQHPGSLAHTGGEEGIALAVGAGALLVGVGVRVASKRRSQR